MKRNFDHRVETTAPKTDAILNAEVEEILTVAEIDHRSESGLQPDVEFIRRLAKNDEGSDRSQQALENLVR